jgi:hypothetical protein
MNYPTRECSHKSHLDLRKYHSSETLKAMLFKIKDCRDTEYRKNITMQLVANTIEAWDDGNQTDGYIFPGAAIALTYRWITGGPRNFKNLTGHEIIEYLKENYFLIAPVDRINEFLVLLGLHMGWDFKHLYYVSCKLTDLDVKRKEFESHFPRQAKKLVKATLYYNQVYEYFKAEFNEHVSMLGEWFSLLVKDFSMRVKKYHRYYHSGLKAYQWKTYKYSDGHMELC